MSYNNYTNYLGAQRCCNIPVKGLPGPQGVPGVRGAQGSQGDQGEPGSQGSQGYTGAQGSNGITTGLLLYGICNKSTSDLTIQTTTGVVLATITASTATRAGSSARFAVAGTGLTYFSPGQ